jgi:prepilin-type N-terminal cleavage/methylation domain-containing protein
MKRPKISKAKQRPMRPSERGMTLLEVTIAATVLCVAMVFTMGSIVSIAATNRINQDQAVAAAAISSMLEEFSEMPFEELMAFEAPSTGDLGATATVTVQCYDASATALALPIDVESLSTPLPNPLEVQVIVTWLDEMGRPFSKQATAIYGR